MFSSIFTYTTSDYQLVNTYLTKGIGDELETVVGIERELREIPECGGEVFRGMSRQGFETYFQEGVFCYPTFLSTSLDKKVGERFQQRAEDGVLLVIKSKSGRYIAEHSHHPEEEEVLFPKETQFEVTQVEEDVIYLEEIDNYLPDKVWYAHFGWEEDDLFEHEWEFLEDEFL